MFLKKCKYCQLEYPESYFEIANVIKGKLYRRSKCKKCKNITQKRRRIKTREDSRKYKEEKGCCQCGIKDHRVLDFHHIVNDKHFNISSLVGWGCSKKVIMDEIDKCILLCSNCHRILHYEERIKEKDTD